MRAYACDISNGTYLKSASVCLEISLKGPRPQVELLAVMTGRMPILAAVMDAEDSKYETSLHLMTHVFCFHPPVLLRLYCHGEQVPASLPPHKPPFRHCASK